MSRLPTILDPQSSSQPILTHSRNRFQPGAALGELEFPHRIFTPRPFEPRYRYPLIVWLHSDGSCELELDNVMCSLSTQNYIAIAPRSQVRCQNHEQRFRWGNTSTDCAAAEDMVWDSIHAAVDSLPIQSDRIFLAGFGAGGTMAQWIGLKYADQIAGVVSINGSFPKTPRPLANWKQARSLEVFFSQRRGSTLCNDQEMLQTVQVAFQSGLRYKFWQLDCPSDSYDDRNELDTSMLQAANRFLMSIVTNSPCDLWPEQVPSNIGPDFGMN